MTNMPIALDSVELNNVHNRFQLANLIETYLKTGKNDPYRIHVSKVNSDRSNIKVSGFLFSKASVDRIDLKIVFESNEKYRVQTQHTKIYADGDRRFCIYEFHFTVPINSHTFSECGQYYLFFLIKEGNRKIDSVRLSSSLDDLDQKQLVYSYPRVPMESSHPKTVGVAYGFQNSLVINVEPHRLQPKLTSITKLLGGYYVRGVVNNTDVYRDHQSLKYAIDIGSNNIIPLKIRKILRDRFYFSAFFSYKLFRNETYDERGVELKLIKDNCGIIEKQALIASKKLVQRANTFKSKTHKLKPKLFCSIFASSKNRKISIEVRNLKKEETRIWNASLCCLKILSHLYKKLSKREIWIVGENLGYSAQDNGIAFFEYLRSKKNSGQSVFYAAKKSNVNWDRLDRNRQNVIQYDSLKHYFLFMASSKIIVSHGYRDATPSKFHGRIAYFRKPIIYLQHGILAMKRIQLTGSSYNGMIEKFIVSSEHEKRIAIEEMNFAPSQVAVTGLARYDMLDRLKTLNQTKKSGKKEKPIRKIVIMPTWRDWQLQNEKTFTSSEFYKTYSRLLGDEQFGRWLKRNNIKAIFLPHIEVYKRFSHLFPSATEGMEYVNPTRYPVSRLMQEGSLLVTDYSSVFWDFNYLGKPTIFFQFDIEDYLVNRGSYIDLKQDLPGIRVESYQELIYQIKLLSARNFVRNKSFDKQSKKFYLTRADLMTTYSELIYRGIINENNFSSI